MTSNGFSAKNSAPDSGVGMNFDQPAEPHLTISTKCRVWGDKSNQSFEPTWAAGDSRTLRSATLLRDAYRCRFCGFASSHNAVHNANDNHGDLREENLWTTDALCHGWHHLGELHEQQGVIAYLPGLSAQDVNHLQRTIFVALQSDDEDVKADAMALLNWAASHRDYTKLAWGTYQPNAFAGAIVRQPENNPEQREVVFADLALIFHPRAFANATAAWTIDAYAAYPVGKWGHTYHAVMNAPV